MCDYKKISDLPLLKQKEIFDKIRNGDFRLREKVITSNLPLVEVLVWRTFGSANYDKEDLIMLGNQELIKSVDTYDPSKNTTFSYYTCLLIKRRIIKFLYKEDKEWFNSFCSLNDIEDENEENCYIDIIDSNYSMDKMLDRTIIKNETMNFLSKLNHFDRNIFVMYYFKGMTQMQIAKIYGMKNHTTVSHKLRKNKKILQEQLEKSFINNDTDLSLNLSHKMY